MWKKEEGKPQATPEKPASPQPVTPAFGNAPTHSLGPAPAAPAHTPSGSIGGSSPRQGSGASISQGIRIKGEVTGSEDLYVDGLVDGKLSLSNGSLTIGPNGTVKADVVAREVIVRGKINGKVSGRDKVHLGSSAEVTGEVQTERLAIDEGALLRGRVEAGRITSSKGSSDSNDVRTVSGSAAD
jgi:cytoskeletal protein CcmA (bactofilin family)